MYFLKKFFHETLSKKVVLINIFQRQLPGRTFKGHLKEGKLRIDPVLDYSL